MIDLVNQSLGPAVCRICMCGETSIPYLGSKGGEPLISPCHCKGTMGLYHRTCLEHWLATSNTKRCEICKFTYRVFEKQRSFWQYVKAKGWRTKGWRERSFVSDMLCLLIISFLSISAIAYCIHSAALATERLAEITVQYQAVKRADYIDPSLEACGFSIIAFFLLIGYLLYFLLVSIYHCTKFSEWREKNMVVYVIDLLDEDQTMYKKRVGSVCYLRIKMSKLWKRFTCRSRSASRSRSQKLVSFIETGQEPILGINPQLIVAFNRTAVDSDNTHSHDSSNPMPFVVRDAETGEPRNSMLQNDRHFALSSPTPYTSEPMTEISLNSPLIDHNIRRSGSLHSVSSFASGLRDPRVTCSTPRAGAFLSVNTPVSTFKTPLRRHT